MCNQDFTAKSGGPKTTKKAATNTALFEVGQIVADRYKIIEEIGQSIAGSVYRVYDQEIDSDVALKAIGPHLLQTSEERKNFSKQLKAARKLHHQNIVRIYDEGTEDDTRFFTMKLLEGLTLRKIIGLRHDKGQAFTTEELVPIFHQLAGALDYAHKTTFHGNLKPENIIILPDLLKVTDFNLIKALPLKPFLGVAKRNKTYPYIAPELKVEATNVDGRADIYSLGVILAEVLTGLLYEGHFTRQFSASLERLPSKMDGLVRKALSEHPDSRYQKASHLAKELEKALAQVPSEGLPPPVQAGEPRRTGKKPPPPPEETRPGMVPEHTDEGSELESYEESLEELGPSQVMMLESEEGSSEEAEDDWEEATDRARLQVRKKDSDLSTKSGRASLTSREPGQTSGLSSKERANKADKLGDTLYSEDDQDLLPPPIPDGHEVEDSYDSLPSGIAVRGETERPAYLEQDPSSLEDDDEDEETATDVLGIHEELTAVGVADDSEEGYTMAPPPLDDSSEEEEDSEDIPPPLPREELAAQGQAPTLRPVTPPPSEEKSKTPLFIAAGLLIILLVVGFIAMQIMGRKDTGDGKIATAVDAGKVIDDAPPKTAEPPAPEATPPAEPAAPPAEPEAKPDDGKTGDTKTNGKEPKDEKAVKKDDERRAELERKEREAKDQADREREEMERKEREAEQKNALETAKALAAQQKRLLEEAERREKDERAQQQRDAELKKREADKRKRDEERRRAEAAERKRKEEEARRKAEEEKKLAAAKKGTECPRGMVMIPGGPFKMGSSPSDPMRNFGEKGLSTVNVPNYCIDYYEFPNSPKRKPTVGVNWTQAFSACKKRGKRLCTEAEWEKACKGPTNRRFPYGNTYKPGKCNTEVDGEAGSVGSAKDFKKCKSKYTIFSLSGNAEEWVSDSFRKGAPSKVAKGGAADRPDWASRCAARRGLSKRSAKKTMGFRCCADPQ